MYTKFFNMDQEKRERILNAALKEFSEKGYERASTNEIVKEAGISKGLLFHYFKNKKELFIFLYDHFKEVMMKEFYSKIDWSEGDLFIKLRKITTLKIQLLEVFPHVFNFFMTAYYETSNDIKVELDRINKQMVTNSYQKILEEIDTSIFKDDIDINKAVEVIIWTIEGYSERVQNQMNGLSLEQINSDQLLEEMDSYFDLLKKAFYK